MMKLFLCLENLISLSPIYWLSRINSCGWVRFIAPEGSQLDIFRSSLLSFEHYRFLTLIASEISTLWLCVIEQTDIFIFWSSHFYIWIVQSYHSKHKQWMDWIVSVLQIIGSHLQFSGTLLDWTIEEKAHLLVPQLSEFLNVKSWSSRNEIGVCCLSPLTTFSLQHQGFLFLLRILDHCST